MVLMKYINDIWHQYTYSYSSNFHSYVLARNYACYPRSIEYEMNPKSNRFWVLGEGFSSWRFIEKCLSFLCNSLLLFFLKKCFAYVFKTPAYLYLSADSHEQYIPINPNVCAFTFSSLDVNWWSVKFALSPRCNEWNRKGENVQWMFLVVVSFPLW